jgi:hypothetical protein
MSEPATFDQSVTVARFERYAEAERAVDQLADLRFRVEQVAIVGRDLRLVEHITGRLGWWGAAMQGAASGAAGGALIGFFFGLFDLVDPLASGLVLALWGLSIGALIGAAAGLAGHAVTGGRRDFTSASSLEAGRFDVVVAGEVAEEAARRVQASRRAA